MENRSFFIGFFLLIVISASHQFISRSKKYVFDENTYDCSTDKSEKKVFDVDLDIIAETEYDMFLNGTMTFLVDVKPPWRVETYGKKLEQGEWFKKLERSVRDFCFSKNNPTDVFYPFFGNKKNCPISKRVSKMNSNYQFLIVCF
jgi:hypothetical protein